MAMSDALASDASPASWPEATTGSLRLGCSDTLSQQHRQKQTYNAKPNIGTADTHALLCSLATIIIIIIISLSLDAQLKVKFSHTRYRALGPELIPVYRQSARR